MTVNILIIILYIIMLYWDIRLLHSVTFHRTVMFKVKYSIDLVCYFQMDVQEIFHCTGNIARWWQDCKWRIIFCLFVCSREYIKIWGRGGGSNHLYWCGAASFWWGILKVRGHLEDVGIDGRIIFKLILKKWVGRNWTVFIWLIIGTSSGFLCAGRSRL
jgi:hypothetical protein